MSVQQVNAKQSNVRKIEPDPANVQGQDIFSAVLLLAEMNKPITDSVSVSVSDSAGSNSSVSPDKESAGVSSNNSVSVTNTDKGTVKATDKGTDKATDIVAGTDTVCTKGDKVSTIIGKPDAVTLGKTKKEGQNIKSESGLFDTAMPMHSAKKDAVPAVDGTDNSTLFKDKGFNINSNKDAIIDNPGSNIIVNDNNALVNAVKGTEFTDNNSLNTQPVTKYVDQGNLIQYMSQQVIYASQLGNHTAKFRLRPAELGDIRLDISVNDKNVKAHIVVENEDVKKMLESSFNQLRDELK